MKPWLQGRLALSQQTSRFELPMDVKLLAGKKYSSETLSLGSDIKCSQPKQCLSSEDWPLELSCWL